MKRYMIALYSINIRIMGGRNVSLFGVETVLDPISAFGLPGYLAALFGSVVYRLAIALALGVELGRFSFAPSDLNLITAVLVVMALVAPKIKGRLQAK